MYQQNIYSLAAKPDLIEFDPHLLKVHCFNEILN